MFNDIPKFNYKKKNNTPFIMEQLNTHNIIGKDWYKIIKSKNEIENKLKARNANLQNKNLSNININNTQANGGTGGNNSSVTGVNNNQFSVNRMFELEKHKDGELNNTLITQNELKKKKDIPNEKFSLITMNKLFDNLDNTSEISEILEENITELNQTDGRVTADYITNIKVNNIVEYNQELINNYNKENNKKQMDNLIDNIHIRSDLDISNMDIFGHNNIGKIQENTNNIKNNYNEKKLQLDEEFNQIGKNIEININKIDKKINKSNLPDVIDEDLKREIEKSNLKIKDIIN